MTQLERKAYIQFLTDNIARHAAESSRLYKAENWVGAAMQDGMRIARECDLQMFKACTESEALEAEKGNPNEERH